MNKKVKYLNHTYNSAIALGFLGLASIGIVILLGFISPNILNSNNIKVGILPLAVGLIGSTLLLMRGLRLRKTKDNLTKTKKNLIRLTILSVLLTFFITGGFLMLLVFTYSIIALVNTNKVIKQSNDDNKNTV